MRRVEERDRSRAGLTAIELLTVMAVIGILVSLIMPAVSRSREAARRTTCLNHLRQVGMAFSNHESVHGVFPSAYMGKDCSSPVGPPQLSPLAAILPFVEQQTIYELLDPCEDGLGAIQDPVSSSLNAQALSSNVTVFTCPSDDVTAGGNSFRISIGTSPQMHETDGSDPGDPARVGALAGVGGVRASRIRDGLSQTVFLSERLVGDQDPDGYTPRRDVFVSGGRMKTPADAEANCRLNAGMTPEHLSYVGSSWLLAGYANTWFNHIATPNGSLPDCTAGPPYSTLAGGSFAARSNHADGVNVVTGDGAGHFVSSSIDRGLWRALGTRSGDEIADVNW